MKCLAEPIDYIYYYSLSIAANGHSLVIAVPGSAQARVEKDPGFFAALRVCENFGLGIAIRLRKWMME